MSTEEFKKAADDVKRLKTRPTDAEMLELYGWYKQATVGDVNTDRPGMFDLLGKAKWDAWNGVKDTPQIEAEKQYVAVATRLIETYGV